MVTSAEREGSQWELGLSLGLSQFGAFSVEVPLLSTMVTSSECRPQSGGTFSEIYNEVLVSLIFFSPFSKVPVIVYRHG
jgi:hypothetical protein